MADQRNQEQDQMGTTLSEGGRGVRMEGSPEDDLMRMGTITTAEPAALPPDLDGDDTFEKIDDRAADEARMEVRRREHSAD
jgi:hypothetical protein